MSNKAFQNMLKLFIALSMSGVMQFFLIGMVLKFPTIFCFMSKLSTKIFSKFPLTDFFSPMVAALGLSFYTS